MIELDNVTLCAADCVSPLLAGRAMDICLTQCKFSDAILFSHETIRGAFRNVMIPRLNSMAAYSTFVLKEMHKHIDSPFVLITQWDGYVANPDAWSADFLKYDYTGATWPWLPDNMRVGNGGFSLRSKRLLAITAQPWFKLLPNRVEDELICQVYRPILEKQFNIRFAPPELAERFSYERGEPRAPTFGFHGMFNFWREMPDDDLVRILPLMPTSLFQSPHCAQLAAAYYSLHRWDPLRQLYRAWRSRSTFDEVHEFFRGGVAAHLVPACMQVCESLLRA